MKRAYLFSLILFLMVSAADAQKMIEYVVKDKEEVSKMRGAPLVVIIKEPDEKELKRLEKKEPERVEEYKHLFDDYNKALKEAVLQAWSFSTDISFATEQEALLLKGFGNRPIYLLKTVEHYTTGTAMDNMRIRRNAPVYGLDPDAGIPLLEVCPASNPKKEIAVTVIPEIRMGTATMTWCVQQLVNQLADCEKGDITNLAQWKDERLKRAPSLKNKTLLLCEDVISDDLKKAIQKNKITSKDYPYSFEIVSYEKLSEIIASKDDKYAYGWMMQDDYATADRQLYWYLIVDAKDGHQLFMDKRMGMDRQFTASYLSRAGKKIEK